MKAALWAHAANPSIAVEGDITVSLERLSSGTLRLSYIVTGRIDDLVVPRLTQPLRTNNLWKTTCFEAFLAPAERQDYRELNFSPSSQWAAYDFSAYRTGMVQASLPAPPEIQSRREGDRLIIDVLLSVDIPQGPCCVGLAAVIEERGGNMSYWALRHAGDVPDFHRRDCFALELPPPKQG